MKKLLNHQAVSEALCQMAAKQPQAAAMLGHSLGPGALSKLPVGESLQTDLLVRFCTFLKFADPSPLKI